MPIRLLPIRPHLPLNGRSFDQQIIDETEAKIWILHEKENKANRSSRYSEDSQSLQRQHSTERTIRLELSFDSHSIDCDRESTRVCEDTQIEEEIRFPGGLGSLGRILVISSDR